MNKFAIGALSVAVAIPTIIVAQAALRDPATSERPAESPLAEFRGFGHDVAADRRAFAADEARRQNMIVNCMREAGFTYRPKTGQIVSGKTYTEQRATSRPPLPRDPNSPYIGGFSDEQKRGYILALYGIPDPDDQSNLWDPSSGQGGGCWGQSLRAIPGVYAAQTALGAEYLAMQQSIAADAEVRKEEAEWAACVRQKGFAISTIAQYHSAMASGGMVRGMERIPEARLNDLRSGGADCLNQTKYSSVVKSVSMKKEAEFVAKHRPTLERFSTR